MKRLILLFLTIILIIYLSLINVQHTNVKRIRRDTTDLIKLNIEKSKCLAFKQSSSVYCKNLLENKLNDISFNYNLFDHSANVNQNGGISPILTGEGDRQTTHVQVNGL